MLFRSWQNLWKQEREARKRIAYERPCELCSSRAPRLLLLAWTTKKNTTHASAAWSLASLGSAQLASTISPLSSLLRSACRPSALFVQEGSAKELQRDSGGAPREALRDVTREVEHHPPRGHREDPKDVPREVARGAPREPQRVPKRGHI